MPIDPRIALGVQPLQLQQPDPNQGMNALARMMQIRGMQDEQQVNALKVDEYKRGVQEENVLRDMYRNPSFSWNDPTQRSAAFAASPTKAQGHYKAFVDADKARFEMAEKRWGAFKQEVGAHINNPNATPQDVARSVGGMVQAGLLDAKDGQSLLASMPQDPQGFRGFLQQIVSSRMTPEQLLTVFAPKPEKIDNGQQVSFRDTNPNSPTYGQATAGGVVQKVATPDAVLASDDRRKSREQSERHHRDGQGGIEYKQDVDGNWVALPKKPGAGPITGQAVFGADGKPLAAPQKAPPLEFTKSMTGVNELNKALDTYEQVLAEVGGPSAMALGEKRAKLQGAYTALKMGLKNAYELGALTGPDVSVLEGALVDPTSPKILLTDIPAQIAQTRSYLKNRESALEATYGKPNPAKKNEPPKRTVKRTGTLDGRKVVEYSDGTVEYAN